MNPYLKYLEEKYTDDDQLREIQRLLTINKVEEAQNKAILFEAGKRIKQDLLALIQKENESK